jgi:hypothetical protein
MTIEKIVIGVSEFFDLRGGAIFIQKIPLYVDAITSFHEPNNQKKFFHFLTSVAFISERALTPR